MMFVTATSSLRLVDERKMLLQLRESERDGWGYRVLSQLRYQDLEGSGQTYECQVSYGAGGVDEN